MTTPPMKPDAVKALKTHLHEWPGMTPEIYDVVLPAIDDFVATYNPPHDDLVKVRDAIESTRLTINTGGKVTRDTEVYKNLCEALTIVNGMIEKGGAK